MRFSDRCVQERLKRRRTCPVGFLQSLMKGKIRKNLNNVFNFWREEDSRVYPGTCPSRPRTKVSNLPQPVIRNEPLDLTEVFCESADEELKRKTTTVWAWKLKYPYSDFQNHKFVIPRRRKRAPTCSVYDFTSSYASSDDETQISFQDTSEYGSQ